jgi:beta-galactosidase/beta-glucuronidase
MRFLTSLFAILFTFAAFAQAPIPRPEYPRPQFERDAWMNLNGTWTYTFDFGESGLQRDFNESKGFDNNITVPFCPESLLSGVEYKDFINSMWYHRAVEVPAAWEGKKILLNFGAVDYTSSIYVNGKLAGRHYGGSSSFSVDVTRFVEPGKTADVVVWVQDDVRAGVQASGKQCPDYYSRGCHYTRVTGIWQTVWMEAVARTGLKDVYVKPDLDNSSFIMEPQFYALEEGLALNIRIKDGDKVVSKKTVKATNPMTVIMPVKNVKTWSPESPFLYDIEYEVVDKAGNVVDQVNSYAGMRKIHVEGNRVYLNNQPLYLRFVLDQGFYPDGVWTAPSDEALKRDIELSMSVGFNGARLHQKVFEERFHYWADKLGYLTWGESASWGSNMNDEMASRNFIPEWREVVVRDRNHPSIIIWTPFNETWERPDDEEGGRVHDRLITNIYDLTKSLDYRPVHDSSGGYHVKTDIWSKHNYEQDSAKLIESQTIKEEGKVPTFRSEVEVAYEGQPYFLDEYGGIKWVIEQFAENTWGYGEGPKSLDEFYTRLEALTDVILSFDYISGYTYTQFTDVEQEQNGIFNYDRTAKFDPERLKAVFGKVPAWAQPK